MLLDYCRSYRRDRKSVYRGTENSARLVHFVLLGIGQEWEEEHLKLFERIP